MEVLDVHQFGCGQLLPRASTIGTAQDELRGHREAELIIHEEEAFELGGDAAVLQRPGRARILGAKDLAGGGPDESKRIVHEMDRRAIADRHPGDRHRGQESVEAIVGAIDPAAVRSDHPALCVPHPQGAGHADGAEVVRFAVPMRAAITRGKDAAMLVIDHEPGNRVDHLHVSQPVVVPDGRDQLPLLGLNG